MGISPYNRFMPVILRPQPRLLLIFQAGPNSIFNRYSVQRSSRRTVIRSESVFQDTLLSCSPKPLGAWPKLAISDAGDKLPEQCPSAECGESSDQHQPDIPRYKCPFALSITFESDVWIVRTVTRFFSTHSIPIDQDGIATCSSGAIDSGRAEL